MYGVAVSDRWSKPVRYQLAGTYAVTFRSGYVLHDNAIVDVRGDENEQDACRAFVQPFRALESDPPRSAVFDFGAHGKVTVTL